MNKRNMLWIIVCLILLVSITVTGLFKIGYYSVNPSIRPVIDYDLGDYIKVEQQSQELLNNCNAAVNVSKCIDTKIEDINDDRLNKLKWSVGSCDYNDKRVFYDIVEDLLRCKNSVDDNCVCKFNLDHSEFVEVKDTYNIVLFNDDGNISARLGKLEDTIYNLDLSLFDDIDYDDKLPKKTIIKNMTLQLEYGSDGKIGGAVDSNDDVSILYDGSQLSLNNEEKHEIILYKSENELSFIDDDNYYDSDQKFDDLESCDTDRKMYRFCVRNVDKTYPVFDEDEKKVRFNPVTIKFALDFENPPPPQIKDLTVVDKDSAERSVILGWSMVKHDDGSSVLDLDHYNIYCYDNETDYENSNIQPIAKVIPQDDSDFLIDLDKCSGEDMLDDKEYYFGVTGVDKAGNENKTVVVVIGTSIDNMPPEKIRLVNGKQNGPYESAKIEFTEDNFVLLWDTPKLNFDGTELYDFHSTLLFYTDSQFNTNPIRNCEGLSCCVSTGALKCMVVDATDTVTQMVTLSTGFEKNQIYSFALASVDNSGNVVMDLSQEWDESNPYKETKLNYHSKSYY